MSSTNILDLSSIGNMSPRYARELNQVADDIRQEYVESINGLSKAYKGDLLNWFVTPFACRNTYVCSVFEESVKAIFARSVIDRGDSIDMIIVDSPILAKMIESHTNSTVMVISQQSFLKYYMLLVYSIVIGLLKYLFSTFLRYFSFKLASLVASKSIHTELKEKVTVIETFAYNESFKGGMFNDRHFTNIQFYLGATELKKVLYIPTFYKVYNSFILFLKAFKSQSNFLFLEEYISIKDILYPLRHMFTLKYKQSVHCGNFDISRLVKHSLIRHCTHTSSLHAILKYRFCNNLKKDSTICINRVVKWYENQELDHGSIMGWRSYSRALNVVGYMGFFPSKNYLCAYPIPVENELNFTPDTIGVMGRGLISQYNVFCEALNFKVMPSFRFSKPNIEKFHLPKNVKFIKIFVPLPISVHHVNDIMKVITDKTLRQFEHAISFIIKPHPASNFALSKHINQDSHVEYVIDNSAVNNILDQVDFVLSAASSTVVEAIMYGVPVLLLSPTQSLRENVIPTFVPNILWDEVYCASELCLAIGKHAHREKLSKSQLDILNDALIEVQPNKENVSRLLGFLD